MMRINPKYDNVCGLRIGMYRQEQCTAGRICPHLSECDAHYDEKTGLFDYQKVPFPKKPRIPRNASIPKLPRQFKRHNGIRETILLIIIAFRDCGKTSFTAQMVSCKTQHNPRSIGNYLRDMRGIKYDQKLLAYRFTGDPVEWIIEETS